MNKGWVQRPDPFVLEGSVEFVDPAEVVAFPSPSAVCAMPAGVEPSIQDATYKYRF